jgi:hypothetical protein
VERLRPLFFSRVWSVHNSTLLNVTRVSKDTFCGSHCGLAFRPRTPTFRNVTQCGTRSSQFSVGGAIIFRNDTSPALNSSSWNNHGIRVELARTKTTSQMHPQKSGSPLATLDGPRPFVDVFVCTVEYALSHTHAGCCLYCRKKAH